jgi:SulP family sulfate permease
MQTFLVARGMRTDLARTATRAGPVAAIVMTTALVWVFGLDERGVDIVGRVPQALPPFTMPSFSADLIGQLLVPAALIAVIGFVESVSVAQTLAARPIWARLFRVVFP